MIRNIFVYIIIILTFWGLGKLVSIMNRPIFKKYIKSKKHENATDIMVNNYWGNIISVLGCVIVGGILFGIDSFTFFAIFAMAIMIAFVFHISNATGYSIDDAITFILNSNNKSVLQYFKGTLCAIIALLVTGLISSNIIAPTILKEENNTNPVQEETNYNMQQTTKDKESEFQDYIEQYFK